ncbi:MAG: C2 family cysteine protease [Myxococcota bacterium]|nr:C2 family cysteine protease [Myxococcota bacterium]
MLKRFGSISAILFSASFAATAAAAPYGSGTGYDRDTGDITSTPVVVALASGIDLDRGTLTIKGGSGNDVASVAPGSLRGTIVAKRGVYTSTFNASDVSKIIFYGNDGDDHFTNTTSIPSEAYGGDGNDVLNGGSGADFLVGGYGQDTVRGYAGNDTIWGSGGSDWLYGGEGNDLVKGHGGNDLMYGENGEDRLYGGTGDDTLYGGNHQDTLVSIGGGYDTVSGYYGNDFFWIDSTDWVSDAGAEENLGAFINRVPAFFSVSYNGGSSSTPIAKDLVNYDLPDPLSDNWDVDLVNFGDRPLFSSVGPNKEDVMQGGTGDCYILGPLAAVADATPESIKKLVVDLDDGTYAVRFYRTEGGAAEYVRVDADLWVAEGTQVPEFGKLSLVEDAIWLPIVEKAWALFRNQVGTYASISGGHNGLGGTIGFGADNDVRYEIDDAVYDAQAIINWHNAGRPAGATANYINTTVPQLLNWIADRQDEGRPVYTGNKSGASNTTAFDLDNWRRGQHIIMIDRVNFDANGNPVSLVLRDQIGPTYRVITDWARIYFLVGRAYIYDMP